MRLLITGPGRSGTTWATKALHAAGIHDAGHEDAYTARRHGEKAWRCEVSWPAAPYALQARDAGVYVVHLTRHPLKVIASRATPSQMAPRTTFGEPPTRLGRFVYDHAPHIEQLTTVLDRAAAHWVHWTRLAEAAAHETLHLETITPGDITRLAHIVDPDAHGITRLPRPVNGHSSTPVGIGWSDIDHIEGLTDTAKLLGYR